MAQKKSYSRYFIILQQDENGYSLSSDKLPSGYTKLETKNDKCKITYYVQNLKKDMEPYYMVLICSKKDVKKLIKLGIMNIDEHGRAEVTYEYNTGNVAGSGMQVDLITGAAVVKLEEPGIVSVMSGFAAAEPPADWRSFEVYAENRNEEPKVESIIVEPAIPVENPEIQVSAPENASEALEQKNTIFDEYEQKIEEVKQEKSKECQIEEEIKASEEPTYNPEDVRKEDEETINEVEYPIGTVGEFFRLVAQDFEEVKDICGEIKRCRWYKINVNSLQDMGNASDYNRYTVVYYPMMSYYPYIKNYGHYLMGYKYDAAGKMKYIVYAVPGTKNINDQPFGGKSGFVTWVSQKEIETRDDEFGYWLMFYDFRTSTVVVPVKKP